MHSFGLSSNNLLIVGNMVASLSWNCPKLNLGRFLIPSYILFTFLVVAIPACTEDQYRMVHPNNTETCVDCPTCQVGQGPATLCGSTVTPTTNIKCVPCVAGKNFSSSIDKEQCSPCSVCGDRIELKTCTGNENAKCAMKCRPKSGKYYDFDLDECQPCMWCCENEDDIVEQECVANKMPIRKRCNMDMKKQCTPRPTAVQVITAKKRKLQTKTTPSTSTQSSSASTQSLPTQVTPEVLKIMKKPTPSGNKTPSIAIIGLIAFIPAAIIGMFILTVLKVKQNRDRCCSCRRQNNDSESRALQDGIELQVIGHPDPQNQLLRSGNVPVRETSQGEEERINLLPSSSDQGPVPNIDESDDLRSDGDSPQSASGNVSRAGIPSDQEQAGNNESESEEIDIAEQRVANMIIWIMKESCNMDLYEKVWKKLDLDRHYEKLALRFSMSRDDIDHITQLPQDGPTKDVLVWLEGGRPNLTVAEFNKELKKIGKRDVVTLIVRELR